MAVETETIACANRPSRPSGSFFFLREQLFRVFCCSFPARRSSLFAQFQIDFALAGYWMPIIPSEAAAFEAMDMIKLAKLAGHRRQAISAGIMSSPASAWSALAASGRLRGCGFRRRCARRFCRRLGDIRGDFSSGVL